MKPTPNLSLACAFARHNQCVGYCSKDCQCDCHLKQPLVDFVITLMLNMYKEIQQCFVDQYVTSTLGFIIFMTIWTLKHSIDGYFLSRNIICKKVTAPTTNVFKSPARFSSQKGSGYVAALVIASYFVDRSCSCSRFSNNPTFDYNHLSYYFCFLI